MAPDRKIIKVNIFIIVDENIWCVYSLEAYNQYRQHVFMDKQEKQQFLVVKKITPYLELLLSYMWDSEHLD